MYKSGIVSLTAEMLQHRPVWEAKFKETFRLVQRNLKHELLVAASHDRMISNVAVLGTTYELMKDKVQFPFAWNDFLSHMKQGMERQIRKLNTASIGMKWWDCFLASIRTKADPIRHGREFKLDDDKLYFNFTHVYNRVAAQWWAQYHEQAPGKSKISDLIKKDSAFIEEKKSVRMDGGRNAHQTSAWVLQANQLSIYEDLYQAVTWSIQEGTATTGDTPY